MNSSEQNNGFTKFPNGLMRYILLSRLTQTEIKIVLAVVRYTVGFHTEEAELSVRFLSKATNIKFNHVSETISALINKKVILASDGATHSRGRSISINCNFDSWQPHSSPKRNSSQIRDSSVPVKGTDRVPKSGTKKENIKENYKDDLNNWFNAFWNEYPKKIARKKAEMVFNKVCKSEQMYQEIMGGLKIQKSLDNWVNNNGQFIPHASTWLNQERWKDEITDKSTGLRGVLEL